MSYFIYFAEAVMKDREAETAKYARRYENRRAAASQRGGWLSRLLHRRTPATGRAAVHRSRRPHAAA